MRRLAILGLVAAGLSLAACDKVSVIADGDQLADRIAIEDMLTSYYSHFGTDANEDFAAYYTEDAVFDVNGVVAEGHEAIVAVYEGLGEPGAEDAPAAAEPAPAAEPSPAPASEGVFHMILSNVEVKVDGDTATASMFWTGVMNEDPFGPPRIVEQGREYDLFVRQDGKWLIKHRVVIADSGMPEQFRATYQPRLDFDITPKP